MWRLAAVALALCAACGLVVPAAAAPVIVLGDSIGVGISMAGKVPRLAHNSVAIRGGDIIEQIRRTPADKIAIVSLGTNDAVGSIAGVERGVDRIVDTAQRFNVHLVWVGPPCVLKKWNANAVKLDRILRARLGDKVSYVSVADPDICARDLRARDGVHFNMKGYALLWERARSAIKEPLASGTSPKESSAEASTPSLAPETKAVSPKRRKHRVATRRTSSDRHESLTSTLQQD